MPWTTPRDWTAGEFVTEAIMDTHIRDNFLASGPHLIVRKTADESVTSSITLQDDNHLLMAVAASEVWQFELTLFCTGLFDFLMQLAFPSGSLAGSAWGIGAGTSTVALTTITSTATPSAQAAFRADSTSVARMCHVQGVLMNGGSPGNLTLQWAQGVSGGTATVLKTNSTLWAMKLA